MYKGFQYWVLVPFGTGLLLTLHQGPEPWIPILHHFFSIPGHISSVLLGTGVFAAPEPYGLIVLTIVSFIYYGAIGFALGAISSFLFRRMVQKYEK